MNIDGLLANYNSIEELKIFAAAQLKQIQSLTKKNKELQEKLDKAPKVAPSLPSANLEISKEDAKTISEIQLNMLKQVAMERELNTDEAKRVELYNRILTGVESAESKKNDKVVKELPVGDLLKLVE